MYVHSIAIWYTTAYGHKHSLLFPQQMFDGVLDAIQWARKFRPAHRIEFIAYDAKAEVLFSGRT
jgi:hypothetical protein